VGDDVIITTPLLRVGANVRKAGEDIASGDLVLEAGTRLRPQDVGLIASIGLRKVSVYRRLRVGIFFTGDELCEPGDQLNAGQIYNSNRYTLRSLLKNLNCDMVDLGVVEDTLTSTISAMQTAAETSDVVMTSGGVSVGEEDYVRTALKALGQLDLWRINMKPGKPLVFGKIGNTPFLGMPGNPVSVFATFCLFASPYLLKKSGATDILPASIMTVAEFEWKKAGSRCEYLRARREQDATGQSVISLFENQGSGVLTSVSWANGFAIIPPNTIIKRGDQVEFISFCEMSVY
jgi:molybdopterin molybdotransferase